MKLNELDNMSLDITILQSKTVKNLVEMLRLGIEKDQLVYVCEYIFKEVTQASEGGLSRKANSIERRIKKLEEMGITINKKEY